jgi:hypothetical protein
VHVSDQTDPPDPAPYGAPPYGSSYGQVPPHAQPTVYGQPPPYGAGMHPSNGLGTTALVLGIIGLVLSWTVLFGVVLGVLALVFGIIGRKRANRHQATNGGSALAGAIMGGIALAIAVAVAAAGAAFFEHHRKAFNNYFDCVNHATTQQQRQQCADDFKHTING